MLCKLQQPRSAYTIDASDRLIDVNAAFVASLPSGFDISTPEQLIGRSLWDFVPGVLPRQLWQVLLRRVRNIAAPVFIPMRTDSPSERRIIDVELHPLGNDEVRHVHQSIWWEPRPLVELLDPSRLRDGRSVARCAWCARIRVRLGTWVEIEEAVQTLGLASTATLPSIEDSACISCKQSILKTFPARAA